MSPPKTPTRSKGPGSLKRAVLMRLTTTIIMRPRATQCRFFRATVIPIPNSSGAKRTPPPWVNISPMACKTVSGGVHAGGSSGGGGMYWESVLVISAGTVAMNPSCDLEYDCYQQLCPMSDFSLPIVPYSNSKKNKQSP